MSLNIRQYKEGDEKQINYLYHSLFNVDRTYKQWDWEFLKTAAGKSLIVVAEDKNGKIQAHDSFIPSCFFYKGNYFYAGKTGDAMISKEYRGKKEFGKITNYCIDETKQTNFSFLWGIARKEGVGYKMRLKTGYQHILDMKAYFTIINPKSCTEDITNFLKWKGLKKYCTKQLFSFLSKRANRLQKKLSIISEYKIELVDNFDDSFDFLWENFIKESQNLTIARTKKYLKWRFENNPNRNYQILVAKHKNKIIGYMILSIISRDNMKLNMKIGTISDFLILKNHEKVFSNLLAEAIKYWKQKNADIVINWIQKESEISAILLKKLKKNGFINSMGKFDIPIYGKKINNKFQENILFSKEKWFATLAFAGKWA